LGKKDIHVLKHLNSMATILIGIIIIMVPNVNAADFERITCFTDKIVYEPGEIVIVTVNNTTSGEIYVTDREYIDGGFATIEIKNNDGTWDPIELIAAANITTLKKLTEGKHIFKIESDLITGIEIHFELDKNNMNLRFDSHNS